MGLGALVQGIDDNGDAERLASLAAISPSNCHAYAAVTAGAAWDNGDHVDISYATLGFNVEFVMVMASQDIFIAPDSSDSDPSNNGFMIPQRTPWVIPCRGNTRIHHKRGGANNATLYISAFGE